MLKIYLNLKIQVEYIKRNIQNIIFKRVPNSAPISRFSRQIFVYIFKRYKRRNLTPTSPILIIFEAVLFYFLSQTCLPQHLSTRKCCQICCQSITRGFSPTTSTINGSVMEMVRIFLCFKCFFVCYLVGNYEVIISRHVYCNIFFKSFFEYFITHSSLLYHLSHENFIFLFIYYFSDLTIASPYW